MKRTVKTRSMAERTALMETMNLYQTKWTREKRLSYSLAHPEHFAGPYLSFPIEDAADVSHAAELLEQAEDQQQVRAGIIRIAREMKLEHALPAAWKEACT